tara:strand:+ start:2592 stop:3632 length:1041 start_codon:yes stop_codon:yes gene_type:complete
MINQFEEIKQRGFDNQKMLLTALAPSLGQVTYDGDLDHVKSLLQGILKSPSIAGISYSDITKTMNVKLGLVPNYNFVDSKDFIIDIGFNKVNEFQVDSFFGLAGNIIYNDSIVGNVVISSNKNIIFAELRIVILIIILGMIIQTFLLWIFFKWVSTVYLHNRLNDIINGLNLIETGADKFTPLKVDKKQEDEISAIQKSFNNMAEKLQISHNEMKAYNKELEEKVQERTAQLEKISITDRLTGLYNRHKIDSVLENELKRSKRSGSSFSLILIDIDDFKFVNDTYGHQMGDKVLIEIANLLLKNTRVTDTTGRWGGEEFLIITVETQLEVALFLAESVKCKGKIHQ